MAAVELRVVQTENDEVFIRLLDEQSGGYPNRALMFASVNLCVAAVCGVAFTCWSGSRVGLGGQRLLRGRAGKSAGSRGAIAAANP